MRSLTRVVELHRSGPVEERNRIMCCNEKKKCQKPENLKGEPRDCSPEQIADCHGSGAEHPCCDKPAEK